MEDKKGYRKGLWTEEEDRILKDYIRVHGKGRWNRVAKMTGLKRGGKSCRLRWINYLSPNIKHGDFSEEEDDLIIRLHNLLGNRWALIAGRVPGRTDNQIKNHWNTHLSKKVGVVKKDRRTKPAGASSQTLSSKLEAANNNVGVPMDTNITETPSEISINVGSADEEQEVIVSDGSKNDQVGLFQVEDQPATGLDEIMSCQDLFWFSNDDPNLISTASLMEQWDYCSFDFAWHGL